MALVYSKTQADSLPLTSFEMGKSEPCYNPDERQDESIFLSTEAGRPMRLGETKRATLAKNNRPGRDDR